MKFEELIKNRYSVRKYSDKKVEKEHIDKILEAARVSPSAKNLQPTRIIVIQDEINKMNEITKCVFGSGCFFIICAKEDNFITKKTGTVDATIALTNMMNMAYSLGLGTCIVGLFDEKRIRSDFKLPDDYKVVMLLICGYPADSSLPSEMHFTRKKLNEIAFKESLDKPYE